MKTLTHTHTLADVFNIPNTTKSKHSLWEPIPRKKREKIEPVLHLNLDIKIKKKYCQNLTLLRRRTVDGG